MALRTRDALLLCSPNLACSVWLVIPTLFPSRDRQLPFPPGYDVPLGRFCNLRAYTIIRLHSSKPSCSLAYETVFNLHKTALQLLIIVHK
ncbi:hypothetical protein C0J52_04875 [Blattella germanica]|nr:hypothetical protein C0J52_04875 [Blattella germanica]